MLKKAIIALVLLAIVAFAWVGLSIYYDSNSVDINPSTNDYTLTLDTSFDLTELNTIIDRTDLAFPVSPDEFLSLIGED